MTGKLPVAPKLAIRGLPQEHVVGTDAFMGDPPREPQGNLRMTILAVMATVARGLRRDCFHPPTQMNSYPVPVGIR
jgi:hypothetical protein